MTQREKRQIMTKTKSGGKNLSCRELKAEREKESTLDRMAMDSTRCRVLGHLLFRWLICSNCSLILLLAQSLALELMEKKFRTIIALWSKTTKNTDWSTGPLARPFTRLLAPLTRLLDPDCSLRSRPPLRSLVRSLAHFTHSLARGKVID